MKNVKEQERILAYQLSKSLSLEEIQTVSGGGLEKGTKEAVVKATFKNNSPDAETYFVYDF